MNTLSFREALSKLEKLCSGQEKCTSDILMKLERWAVSDKDKEKIINNLKSNTFLDDARYATMFVRDKHNLNKWGKEKIRFELAKKRIEKGIIDKALSEIDSKPYLDMLKEMLIKKKKSIKYSGRFD